MSKSDKIKRKPSHEAIAACARILYEMEGQPEGRALEHWLLAESLLIADAEEYSRRPAVRTTTGLHSFPIGDTRPTPKPAANEKRL